MTIHDFDMTDDIGMLFRNINNMRNEQKTTLYAPMTSFRGWYGKEGKKLVTLKVKLIHVYIHDVPGKIDKFYCYIYLNDMKHSLNQRIPAR